MRNKSCWLCYGPRPFPYFSSEKTESSCVFPTWRDRFKTQRYHFSSNSRTRHFSLRQESLRPSPNNLKKTYLYFLLSRIIPQISKGTSLNIKKRKNKAVTHKKTMKKETCSISFLCFLRNVFSNELHLPVQTTYYLVPFYFFASFPLLVSPPYPPLEP